MNRWLWRPAIVGALFGTSVALSLLWASEKLVELAKAKLETDLNR